MQESIFTTEQISRLDEYRTARLQLAQEYCPNRQKHLAAHINAIYKMLDLPDPLIVQCRNPFEQATYPAIVDAQLKRGQESSSGSRLMRQPLDTDEVVAWWANLWSYAHKSIDWEKGANCNRIGQTLNKSVLRLYERRLRMQLVGLLDTAFGFDYADVLQESLLAGVDGVLTQLHRATTLDDFETAALWDNFLSRLPDRFLDLLEPAPKKSEASKKAGLALAYSVLGPNATNWLDASTWKGLWGADFARNHLRLALSDDSSHELDIWLSLAESTAAIMFCENCCFVYVRPTDIHFDQAGRLHNPRGPAIVFSDGSKNYYWRGLQVTEQIILYPHTLKVSHIENCPNAEVRRVMIERFGFDNFIRESGARKVQEDDCGILYRKTLPGDEPLVAVKVVNSTPEPDGSFKTYILRVPPTITTARAAVAWSFGMQHNQYKPKVET